MCTSKSKKFLLHSQDLGLHSFDVPYIFIVNFSKSWARNLQSVQSGVPAVQICTTSSSSSVCILNLIVINVHVS